LAVIAIKAAWSTAENVILILPCSACVAILQGPRPSVTTLATPAAGAAATLHSKQKERDNQF